MSNNSYVNTFDVKEVMKNYDGGNYTGSLNEMPVSWQGFKDFILVDKIKECDDIISFYFKPKDGKKLIKHDAGQYFPIRIKTNDSKYKNEIRTYSLSMKPNEYVYRISVKKIDGGLISTYLHETLQVGDMIEAMVPTGIFTLDKKKHNEPIVLLSGGIGITPLLSMLYESVTNNKEVHFVQAVQNSKVRPFKNDVEFLSKQNNIKNIVFYDRPLESDVEGEDYNYTGFITKEWIEENLPLNSEFYFCGPPVFMRNLNRCLLALGVEKEKIHYEFFGEPQLME